MSRSFLAASLVAVLAVAACSAAPARPSPSPSADPVDPSAAPILSPSPIATPERPAPVLSDFTRGERYLFDGVRRGAIDCEPAAGSDELPRDAIAGIECYSDDPAVSRIGFYLFENEADMLDAYLFRMKAEGVALESGSCLDGDAEHAYIPGEGLVPFRVGCFINEEGYANYRATLPGSHVYIGILGRSSDSQALEDFTFRGSRDTPSYPTLWGDPS